ncbi:hypothetical protein K6Y31_04110 [Motilimonas cestriensis]|uniref:Orphan protein n=2 Tax=Motilimonas cestriensis TaxID=2742685 RepID=A0ABS8W628_9GAMM|nr:hypothetical protein [Motilimonas cestriensis]
MKLSKKAWNNVLIFAVLGMIFIFNFSHKRMLNEEISSPKQTTLLPSHSMILTMQGPDYTIERIGRSWRSRPDIGLAPEQLNKMMNAWLSEPLATLELPTGQLPVSQFSQVYQFWLAGVDEPVSLTLYQLESGLVISNWQSQLLQLDELNIHKLLPK